MGGLGIALSLYTSLKVTNCLGWRTKYRNDILVENTKLRWGVNRFALLEIVYDVDLQMIPKFNYELKLREQIYSLSVEEHILDSSEKKALF